MRYILARSVVVMRYILARSVLERAGALTEELCTIRNLGPVLTPGIILKRFSCCIGNAIVEDCHPLHICTYFKVPKQSLATAFNTIGPPFYEGLKNFHTANLPRPKRRDGLFQDLALAVDTTYFPIPLTHGEVGSS